MIVDGLSFFRIIQKARRSNKKTGGTKVPLPVFLLDHYYDLLLTKPNNNTSTIDESASGKVILFSI